MGALKRKKTGFFAAILAAALLLSLLPAAALGAEAEDPPAGFDGYLVRVESAPPVRTLLKKSLMKTAAATPDMVEGVEATGISGLYHADTLEAAEQAASLAGNATLEPNYILELPQETVELSAKVVSRENAKGKNLVHLQTVNLLRKNGEGTWERNELYGGLDRDLVRGGQEDIVVAVIDSGLVVGHEDIPDDQIIWPDKSFLSNVPIQGDSLGHGTFVTGEILGAVDELGTGGLTPQVSVMPLRLFQSGRVTTTLHVISALEYVTQQKTLYDKGEGGTNIRVVNMSFGGPDGSTLLKKAMDAAIDAGIILICAAGNDGDGTATYPAQYAIGVGSTDADGGMDGYDGAAVTARSYTQQLSEENKTG